MPGTNVPTSSSSRAEGSIGPPPPDPGLCPLAGPRRTLKVEVSKLLDGWREKFPTVAVTVESVAGHPYQILTESTRDAQLVVVGARGCGGFHGLHLGSVTRHLLHGSSTIAVIR